MAAIAWIIGAVAGYVAAVSFVLFQGLFTSHAAGDTAHLGRAVAGVDGAAVIKASGWNCGTPPTGVLWVVFLAGAVFGAYAQHLWVRAAEMNLCCAGHYRF